MNLFQVFLPVSVPSCDTQKPVPILQDCKLVHRSKRVPFNGNEGVESVLIYILRGTMLVYGLNIFCFWNHYSRVNSVMNLDFQGTISLIIKSIFNLIQFSMIRSFWKCETQSKVSIKIILNTTHYNATQFIVNFLFRMSKEESKIYSVSAQCSAKMEDF